MSGTFTWDDNQIPPTDRSKNRRYTVDVHFSAIPTAQSWYKDQNGTRRPKNELTITQNGNTLTVTEKKNTIPVKKDEDITQKSPDTQGSRTNPQPTPKNGPVIDSGLPKYPSAELRPYKNFTTKADAMKYANQIGVRYLDPKFTLEQMNLILREYSESLSSGYPITDSVIAKKYDPKVGIAIAQLSKNNDSFYAYTEEPYWSNPEGIAKEYNKVPPDKIGTWNSTADPADLFLFRCEPLVIPRPAKTPPQRDKGQKREPPCLSATGPDQGTSLTQRTLWVKPVRSPYGIPSEKRTNQA